MIVVFISLYFSFVGIYIPAIFLLNLTFLSAEQKTKKFYWIKLFSFYYTSYIYDAKFFISALSNMIATSHMWLDLN